MAWVATALPPPAATAQTEQRAASAGLAAVAQAGTAARRFLVSAAELPTAPAGRSPARQPFISRPTRPMAAAAATAAWAGTGYGQNGGLGSTPNAGGQGGFANSTPSAIGGTAGNGGAGTGGGMINFSGGTVLFKASNNSRSPAATTFIANVAKGGAGGDGAQGGRWNCRQRRSRCRRRQRGRARRLRRRRARRRRRRSRKRQRRRPGERRHRVIYRHHGELHRQPGQRRQSEAAAESAPQAKAETVETEPWVATVEPASAETAARGASVEAAWAGPSTTFRAASSRSSREQGRRKAPSNPKP